MSKRRKYYLVFLICSTLVYELPYFLTLQKNRMEPTPCGRGLPRRPDVVSQFQRHPLQLTLGSCEPLVRESSSGC